MKTLAAVARIGIASMLFACAGLAVADPPYPSKPIRFIIPYPPGGGTSIVARLVGQKLTESWGQAVVVDNRGGGGTVIGTEALVNSHPDGYTILMVSSTHVLSPLLIQTPYDVIKDFAPVTTLYRSELMLVVNPAVPANTLQELIALAKANPGKLNYATVGGVGTTRVAGEMLNTMAGIKLQNINYRGAGPALSDLVGGHVQASFVAPVAAMPFLTKSDKAGDKAPSLRAIAVTGEKRVAALPDVPTFAEAGLPGFDMTIWFGVVAPAGTPKEIVAKLAAEFARIMALPDIKEKLASEGLEPSVTSPDQFAALMKTDMAKFAKIVKEANITAEE